MMTAIIAMTAFTAGTFTGFLVLAILSVSSEADAAAERQTTTLRAVEACSCGCAAEITPGLCECGREMPCNV